MSARISFGAVVLVSGACWAFVPQAAFGDAQLRATATATALALAGALLVAGIVVRSNTGAFVPAKTLFRVGAAVGLAFFAGHYAPRVKVLGLLVSAALVAIAYVAFLLGTGELGRDDLAMVRTLVSRKKRAV